MSIFGFKSAKKKLSTNSLALRKTQSTGDIEDSRPVLNTNSTNHHQRARKISFINKRLPSSSSIPRPNTTTYSGGCKSPNDSTISSILITSSSYVGDQSTPLSQQPQQQTTDQITKNRTSSLLLSQNKTLPPVIEGGASGSDNDSNINSTNQADNSSPSSPQNTTNNSKYNDGNRERLAARLRDLTAVDMELLLSLETQARMDHQEEKEQLERERRESEQSTHSSNSMSSGSQSATPNGGRPSRLRFDIPAIPAIRSPDQNITTSPHSSDEQDDDSQTDQQEHGGKRRWSLPDIVPLLHQQQRQNRISRWGRSIMFRKHSEQDVVIKEEEEDQSSAMGSTTLLSKTKSNTSNASNSSGSSNLSNTKKKKKKNKQSCEITVGCRVQLYKRPLPIIGTVKYIGAVQFDATGEEWLGIELDGRVGNTDGKIDDIRYFQCNPNCGIFVKKEDARKVS